MKLIIFTLCISFAIQTSSFTPASSISSPYKNTVSSTLHLVPSQGCQLAAATTAALAKQELEREQREESSRQATDTKIAAESLGNRHSIRPSDATREFVSRLFKKSQNSFDFTIPAMHGGPLSSSNDEDHKKDDIVLFPIIGFQYVKLNDGSIRGIPTINASPEKVSCNLDAMQMKMTQPEYGWFSPCCQLGDLFSDHEEYCGTKRWMELNTKLNEESHPSGLL